MNKKPERLLIVDDEEDMGEIVAEIARELDVDPVVVTTAEDCLQELEKGPVMGIFLDLVMPGMDGIELVKGLTGRESSAPICLMTGYDRSYMKMTSEIAAVLGADVIGRLSKPLDLASVETLIKEMRAAAT
ncbi:MAG: response regulator [Magnetovibrionaceae bacterium]